MKAPIETLQLFPLINSELTSFLKQLSPNDWQKRTIARQWVVKDVAAHLLDGNFRRIALHRDKWMPEPDMDIRSHHDLVRYLNILNADWVKAAKRLSPGILVELLEETNEVVYSEFLQLDPFAVAAYPVTWAGQTKSFNWFDIAREYTERWLHQQQIRDALNNKDLMRTELYQPFLNVLMQAWPHSLKGVEASEGTVIKMVVTGAGEWYLRKAKNGWTLLDDSVGTIIAETIIDGNLAWKLFSKSIRREDVRGGIKVSGNEFLGEKILDMVAVMA